MSATAGSAKDETVAGEVDDSASVGTAGSGGARTCSATTTASRGATTMRSRAGTKLEAAAIGTTSQSQ
jgi:hypothetical protein